MIYDEALSATLKAEKAEIGQEEDRPRVKKTYTALFVIIKYM
jgi:hypothetical protein